MAVARTVLTTAMISVFPKDVRSALFSNSFTYQLNVNPFQLRYGFEVVALNEFAITTEIGRKRNRSGKNRPERPTTEKGVKGGQEDEE